MEEIIKKPLAPIVALRNGFPAPLMDLVLVVTQNVTLANGCQRFEENQGLSNISYKTL